MCPPHPQTVAALLW